MGLVIGAESLVMAMQRGEDPAAANPCLGKLGIPRSAFW